MREIKFRAWNKITEQIVYNEHIVFGSEGTVEVGGYSSVDEVELMQYTGLKDKNGVEIYEGDILEAPNFQTAPIEFIDNGFWCKQGLGANMLPNLENTEVIGNIYENKELLK